MTLYRTACALAVAISLTACVNLQAISTYSASAASVTGLTEIAQRWRDSEKKLLENKVEGDVCPIGRTGRLPQARFDAAFVEATSVHKAMSEYFIALGELASDKLPNVATTATTSLGAIKSAGIKVAPEEEAAVKALFTILNRALDAYRHKKVRDLMQQTHGDIASVLALMQKLAEAYAEEVRGEGIQAVNFVRCEVGQLDLADKYVGRRELVRVRKHYDQELAAIAKYKTALQKLADDHAKIRDALAMDRNGMERTLKAIAATAKELDKARDAIANL